MEQLGKAPCQSIAFEHAVPSLAHRTLVHLERLGELIEFHLGLND